MFMSEQGNPNIMIEWSLSNDVLTLVRLYQIIMASSGLISFCPTWTWNPGTKPGTKPVNTRYDIGCVYTTSIMPSNMDHVIYSVVVYGLKYWRNKVCQTNPASWIRMSSNFYGIWFKINFNLCKKINLSRAFKIAITSFNSAFANFESEVKPAL